MQAAPPSADPDSAATDPALARLIDRVRAAKASGQALELRGHGSKAFYGGVPVGERLELADFAGISSYEPTELVVTARAGTPIVELEAALAERGQCLPFEPPRFGAARTGTVGGMVAAGLAGPSRATAGAVRDHVLGATLLNGRGEVLSFGGQVIKNVAGYDVSRLLVGSMGVLGIVLEASLKVLPVQRATATLRFEMSEAAALHQLHGWGGQPLPLSASAWWSDMLVVRLRGAQAAVDAAVQRLGGEVVDEAAAGPFWDGLRDHRDEYFVRAHAALTAASDAALWRLSVPQTAPPIALHGAQLIEWGGAQRWWFTTAPASAVRELAQRAGGHATLFCARDKTAGAFQPMGEPLAGIHRALKQAFDPAGIFNRGRLMPDL